jgi:hypothetical protein
MLQCQAHQKARILSRLLNVDHDDDCNDDDDDDDDDLALENILSRSPEAN